MKKFAKLPAAVLALFILITISGCSSRSSASKTFSASTEAFAEEADTGAGAKNETAVNGAQKNEKDTQSASEKPDAARKIVKRANLTVQTENYDKSVSAFESLVTEFGGYLQSSTIEGNGIKDGGFNRNATCVARIPSDRLDEFLNSVSGTGSIVRKSVNGEDITQNYYDMDSRLKTLRVEQTRLRELMAKANKVEDLLSIEQRLSEVETQIEELTGGLKRMDSLISLSTVTVKFQEVRVISAGNSNSLGGQVASMFRTSLNALSQTGRFLLLTVTAIFPFAAVALVLLAIFFFIRKRCIKKKIKTPTPTDSDK